LETTGNNPENGNKYAQGWQEMSSWRFFENKNAEKEISPAQPYQACAEENLLTSVLRCCIVISL